MSQAVKLRKEEVEDILPITPVQTGMLLHYMNDKECGIYIEQVQLDIQGYLDRTVFDHAFQVMVKENEILRTIYRWEKVKQPLQIILKEKNIEVTYHKQEILEKNLSENDLEHIKEEEINKINLAESPLQIAVVNQAEKSNILLITYHHILLDGWSISVFLEELFSHYESIFNHNECRLFPKSRYKDFVLSCIKVDTTKQKQFWSCYLEEFQTITDFIGEYKKSYTNQFNILEYKHMVSKNFINKMTEFLKRNMVSSAAFFFTTWGILLQQYSNCEDVLFGTTTSGRSNGAIKHIKNMLGLFINTIPLRMKFSEKDTFLDVIHMVEENLASRIPYENTSLIDIKDCSYFKNSQTELFSTIVVLENYPISNQNKERAGLSIVDIKAKEKTHYDLSLGITSGEYLELKCLYRSDLFSEDYVKRLIFQYETLMELIIDQPNECIGNTPILSNDERSKVLVTYNKQSFDIDEHNNINNLFEDQVKLHKNSYAVICREEKLTYEDLDIRSNRVKEIIISKMNENSDVIGVMSHKSIDLIVIILGIVKAKATYLPIDITYPKDRIEYIINDSNVCVIFTEDDTKVPEDYQGKVIQIQKKDSYLKSTETIKNHQTFRNSTFSYLIYTSGTTGNPKGVSVEENSLLNFLFCYQRAFDKSIQSNDKCLSLTSISFDVSIAEIFISLVYGATLVLYSKEQLDITELCNFIIDEEITMAYLPQSVLLEIYLQLKKSKEKLKLNKLLVGVEPIDENIINKFYDLNPDMKIVNGYGPTETTICATFYKNVNKYHNYHKLPIGQPLANTQIYLLNKQLVPVIDGGIGEICIAGAGLAKGYLNQTELTSQKFVDNPFGSGKMYRSGDYGRWLPNGNLEYMGRVDGQIKLRGYRIELGEVTAAILKCNHVKDAAVVVKKSKDDRNILCSFIVTSEELNPKHIRAELSQILPNYMIPTQFMTIDQIPLTRNGKLNVKALSDIAIAEETDYMPPRNHIETMVAKIYEEVLNVESVGIYDDFFQLGGHSLKVTALSNQIEVKTGVKLSLRDCMNASTVESLSELIMKKEENQYDNLEISHVQKQDFYPMSSAEKRLYFIQQLDENSTNYNISSGFEIIGELDCGKVEVVFQKLVDRHDSLRTCFIQKNEEYLQYIENDVKVHVPCREMTDEESVQDEWKSKALKAFIRPFDITKAPLIRCEILKKKDDHYLLLFDMHHIIADGFSSDILMREFSTLYNDCELVKQEFQYVDYSEWFRQKNWTEDETYWKRIFQEEIPVLNLPLDGVRQVDQKDNGDSHVQSIMPAMKQQIQEFCKTNQLTDYMFFVTALMITLSQYSQQEDIIIGTPVAGRTNAKLDHIVGMLVNTLALRAKPEGKKTINDFMNEVKEMCLGAYEHQEYPFEELVELVEPHKELGRNPLFDVLFVLQNQEKLQLELNGLMVISRVRCSNQAKFDLTFEMEETEKEYTLRIEYSSDLFDKKSIENIGYHYLLVMNKILENTEKTIEQIEMVDSKEKNLILKNFNQPIGKVFTNSIGEIFAQQARLTPHNVALQYNGEALNYEQMYQKAGKVANRLIDLGVKKNDNVAIISDRNLELMIGIYGIWLALGVYVPIAPDYPENRIRFMLKDCNPQVVIVQDNLELPFDFSCQTIRLKKLVNETKTNVSECSRQEAIFNMKEEFKHIQPKDISYLIYTSGTTGVPKGSLNTQVGVLNTIQYLKETYQINESDVILFKTSYSFDVSIGEIMLGMMSGARTIILPNGAEKEPETIIDIIEKEQVTFITFVPSMLIVFLNHIKNHSEDVTKIESLRHVIAAGEVLNDEVVEIFHSISTKHHLSMKLSNLYGPSEAAIYATGYEIDHNHRKVHIGKPIHNMQAMIMRNQRLCGIGIPGELVITGVGLSVGYLNQKELTKEKFIENPFGDGKAYRTGDLARWLPDGNIEYLGRMDNQVKVRGFRIELGEIENVLRRDALIKNCAVVIHRDETFNDSIDAYIVSDENVNLDNLRKRLKKLLPAYMIPNKMLQIEKIPVTKNGKMDQRELPIINVNSQKRYIKPRNQIEEKVAQIYKDILGLERVGIKDDFFELGGHSLRAIRLVNQIETACKVKVSLKECFQASTVELLSDFIIARENDDAKQGLSISKADTLDCYPLSSVQKRMYTIWKMDEFSTAYNMPVALELKGHLDLEKVDYAFREVIRRHESLRTRFGTKGGEMFQWIDTSVDEHLSYRQFEKDSITTNIVDVMRSELKRFVKPFDLGMAPLARLEIISFDENHSLFLFDMHHIISDGMSMNIIMNEFSKIYNGVVLDEQKLQYKDYINWFMRQDMSPQKQYWRDVFFDGVTVLDLPLDGTRNNADKNSAGQMISYIESPQREMISMFCQENEITEYMLFLSSLMITLSMYSQQDDIIIGSPVSGRMHSELENVVGMFVNTLPMRGKPEKHKMIQQFLLEVKENCLKSFMNQEYPFEELVNDIVKNYNTNRNPLFDVMLVLQNNEKTSLALNDISICNQLSENDTAKFDLTFTIVPEAGTYGIHTEYNKGILKYTTVQGIIKHWTEILIRIMKDANCTIKDIQQISEEEKNIILSKFNDTTTEYSRTSTVVEEFEKQVKLYPNNVAVWYEDQYLTYHQLNEKANQIATQLRFMGVGRNDFVAIDANKSLSVVVGIIGILKAGGAYIPIDSNYPMDRIQYILNDSKPKAFLEINEVLAYEVDHKLSIFDSEYEDKNTDNLVPINKPTDLAYIIYTSGTTGRPKGSMIEHRSILRLVQNTNFINLDEKTRVLQTGSLSFDASTFELFGPLLHGGSVHFIRKEDMIHAAVLKETIIHTKTNTMWMTAALYNQMIIADQTMFDSLDVLLIGGERLTKEYVNQFVQRKGKCKFINGYGPTEATTFATTFEIEHKYEYDIPIGKPISNTQIYIMNENELCPIGVRGELCIAGDGVARGYLNLDGLTKERFVPNPFGEGRLYRSGDYAKWREDGIIEYLGRIDGQVKINGFRVELGEIESTIRKHSLVKDCTITIRKEEADEAFICAYFVSDVDLDFDEMKEFLREDLPNYMIPHGMMQIASIPVTKNGKVDKRALPEINIIKEKEYIAPENDLQKTLVTMFEEILAKKPIGIRDNFFELGGHSLKATRFINWVEDELGVRITLKECYKNATVQLLTDLIEKKRTSHEIEVLPIKKVKRQNRYKMSSSQKRLYFIQTMEKESTAYNIPTGFHITGKLSKERLENALKELILRHDGLRTYFGLEDGEPIQYIEENVDANITYERLSQREAKNFNEMEALKNFVQPFDVRKAPLFRVKVIEKNHMDYDLLFDIHHIISDGISMNIILKDFSKLYNEETLNVQNFQYIDYSSWLEAKNFQSAQEYWKGIFEDEIPVLDFPTDYKRTITSFNQGDYIKEMIPLDVMTGIHTLCNELEISEFMLYLSSLMICLSKYSNQEDIVIGTTMSGRTIREIETIVGMMVNTLAMRGKPEKEKKIVDFIQEVKDICLNAYEYQEYPMEDLIDDFDITRDMSRNPFFDVMLSVQNFEETNLTLNELKCIQFEELNQLQAKFDMTINVITKNEIQYLYVEYRTDLYRKETIQNFVKHYIDFIQQILVNRTQKIGDLNLITKEEYYQVVEEFNQTELLYDENETIIHRFEKQVRQSRDKLAIIMYDKEITYGEFYDKVTALAKTLRSMGIKQNDCVAIVAQRSIEMIVGIYGILLSGAAYVPIDPNYPKERIAFMLEDCKPKAILKYQTDFKDAEIPMIDLEQKTKYLRDTTPIEIVTRPGDLAYIIYTSGTTGQPKGVTILHKGLANLMKAYEKIYELTKDDVVLQVANYIFDQSVWDIFGIILKGGTLCLISYEDIRNPEAIRDYCNQKKVTIASFTPALITELDPNGFQTLRILDSSGEAAMKEVLKGWVNKVRVINTYGPTETTVNASSYEYMGDNPASIPIGGPICNTQFYVVNHGHLCGIGILGELCIAGVSLSSGYLNQPTLTEQKFVNSIVGPGKMYRTGDLVRWLPGGIIEYFGRMDEQVKIRGYRIELGEIEGALRNLSKIQDCAVIVRGEKENKYICGYYVSGESLDSANLRRELGKSLPDYMIPAGLMQISEIPITPSGKLDRRKLPEVTFVRENKFIKPKTFVEKVVANIFEEILNVPMIGLQDDFFELGGHSLKAVKLVDKIREQLHVGIPLKDVFYTSTVEKISELIENHKDYIFNDIKIVERADYYEASSAQKRIFIVQQKEPENVSYNIPTVLRIDGKLELSRIQETMKQLVKRHESFRTQFDVVEDELVQIVLDEVEIPFEHEFLDNKKIDDVIDEFIRPFDLMKAPLIRMKVVEVNKEQSYVIFDVHHIIFDGVSSAVLLKDFVTLYNLKDLKTLRIHYKDFAKWQNDYLTSQALKLQEMYWLEKYKDRPTGTPFVINEENRKISDFAGSNMECCIDEMLTANLNDFVIANKSTLYITLISVYAILIHKYTNEADLIIGSPYAGRKVTELDQLIGMFVNMLPMRLNIDERQTFLEVVMHTKKEIVSSIENSDYQFEELVHKLGLGTSKNENPLFHMVFALQNIETDGVENLSIDGIKVEPYHFENNSIKFDLLLNAVEAKKCIELTFNYKCKVFSKDVIQKMAAGYLSIIQQVMDQPGKTIQQIEVEFDRWKAESVVNLDEMEEFDF